MISRCVTLGTWGTREVRLKARSLYLWKPPGTGGRAVLEEEFPGLRHLQGKQRREAEGLQMPGEEASESVMTSKQRFGRMHGNVCHESSKEEWEDAGPTPQA